MTLNEALDSEKVKEFVKDDKQAKDFYAAFCNRDWFPSEREIKKEDIGNGDGFTWRAAGNLVAGLREKGETYMDFYCGGNEGKITKEIAELMFSLGWKSVAL